MLKGMVILIVILAVLTRVLPTIISIVLRIRACRGKPRQKTSGPAKKSQQYNQLSAVIAAMAAHSNNSASQMQIANDQAMQAHMQAVHQHQQFVDQVNQQQFDHFCWQSVTPINQGGFVNTGTGMF